MEAQVFGTKKNAETRKALRFFAERRIRVHFVDLRQRAASRGELNRFAQKFGVEKLIDRESKRFATLGLTAARFSGEQWFARLLDDPLLLRMPLVRCEQRLTVGLAEATWRAWLAD